MNIRCNTAIVHCPPFLTYFICLECLSYLNTFSLFPTGKNKHNLRNKTKKSGTHSNSKWFNSNKTECVGPFKLFWRHCVASLSDSQSCTPPLLLDLQMSSIVWWNKQLIPLKSLSSSSINDAMHCNRSLRLKLRFSFVWSVLYYQSYHSWRNKHNNALVSIQNFQFTEMAFNKLLLFSPKIIYVLL